jgi:hypothetical protein
VDPNGLWDQYKPLAGFFQGEDLAPTRPMTANAGADAIALSLQSQNRAVVWVRSQQYDAIGAIRAYEKAFGAGTAGPNWTFQPPTLCGLALALNGLQDGAYTARWFDPQTGRWLAQATVQATGGALSLPVPDFSRDLALKFAKNWQLLRRVMSENGCIVPRYALPRCNTGGLPGGTRGDRGLG